MRRRRGGTRIPDRRLCAGPARLCEALAVTGALNGASLAKGALRVVRGAARRAAAVIVGPRIGITAAADWPLRFYYQDSPWISR
jgi:DNA-3-methyladenine glycosylase